MRTRKATAVQHPKPGTSGVWWHDGNRGPLEKLPFIGQFGCMKFTRVNLDKNMKPHFNDGIEIHYVESGKYAWEFEGKTVELLPDDLSITAPWHLNGSPEGKMDLGRISWIILKPLDFSPEKPLNLGKWTQLPRSFQSGLGQLISCQKGIVLRKAKTFKKYVTELEKELTRQEKGYRTVVTNLLENFLIELHRELESRKLRIERQDSFISRLGQLVS
ncbi:MAG TPA: AraC family ligand binding domain-containing protein, partial [Anseongella sp.]|nr:AraC family ligand binding domain-containing protein [Anseongella sp.]